jgi:hypothetical protein
MTQKLLYQFTYRSTIVSKHTDRYTMANRRRTMLPFTHQMIKIKQTKITKKKKNIKKFEKKKKKNI